MESRRSMPNLNCMKKKEKDPCKRDRENFTSSFSRKDYRKMNFLCSRNFFSPDWANIEGEPFLIKSVKNNDLTMVRVLIEKCLLNPFEKDNNHRSTLDHARWDYEQKKEREDKKIFNYLIKLDKK